jgi:methylphosphotriester-DNA--protein-cysteine methyltransferase
MHADLLAQLDLTSEYAHRKATEFQYEEVIKPRWTWELAVSTAQELLESDGGDLPTVEWCRLNGYGQLTSFVFQSGRRWEDLREAVGLPPSVSFFGSRCGIRWRIRPEACLSNFLYARGIEHRLGERYPDGYSVQSGRSHGRYDVHFMSKDGTQIDVEIWGDIRERLSHGRYAATRALKEAWHDGRPTFLGLHYLDCQDEGKLTGLLEPYIGIIAPFQFDKPQDHMVETAHWSDVDELLESCREFAKQMPDGLFPGDEWLRKRGRYANRPGDAYNTLAVRVNQWLHGTRNVRKLVEQEGGTTKWTAESAVAAWQAFEEKHGVTPAGCASGARRGSLDKAVVAEGARIYSAVHRFGVLEQARRGRTGRKVKWTPKSVVSAWRAFHAKYGLTPSQAMGPIQRQRLSRDVVNEGARIYNTALRLGVVDQAKSG